MRAIVCGGRDYDDEGNLFRALDSIGPTFVIEGGARGADTLAWRWAKRRLPSENRLTIEARWDKHGRAAGPMRNRQMIEEGKPDVVIAFPGGKGTKNMISQARKAGIKVIEVGPDFGS